MFSRRNYGEEKHPGIGFAMYSSLPFSLNARFAKRVAILKNLNFSATINPLVSYSSDRYLGTSFKYGLSAELGLRVNWRS
ncbi:MAG: hypothetical protein PSX36_03425 [bacterium]|nr:hypothetical protein [bacterium]